MDLRSFLCNLFLSNIHGIFTSTTKAVHEFAYIERVLCIQSV